MGPLLQEVAAIKLILAHLLSRMPQDELRELSENISNQLQHLEMEKNQWQFIAQKSTKLFRTLQIFRNKTA